MSAKVLVVYSREKDVLGLMVEGDFMVASQYTQYIASHKKGFLNSRLAWAYWWAKGWTLIGEL